MFSVYADDICIYDDRLNSLDNTIVEPYLTLTDNDPGSFEFTIPNNSKNIDLIEPLKTIITVRKNGGYLWSGRVFSKEYDFWKNKKFYCVGELSYLLDTIQPPYKFPESETETDRSVERFLFKLLQVHNSHVGAGSPKTILKGNVTVVDSDKSEQTIYRYTNYETTFDCILEKLVDRLGGHLRLRRDGGNRLSLDYYTDDTIPSVGETQTIEFGKNLLDFLKSSDLSKLYTSIVPLGALQYGFHPDDFPAVLDYYINIKDIGVPAKYADKFYQSPGSYSLEYLPLKNLYGVIEKVVSFDEIDNAMRLIEAACEYMLSSIFEDAYFEIKAVDLSQINPDIKEINLLDKIQVISKIHGLDDTFMVTNLNIPLDEPENMVIQLGKKTYKPLSKLVKNRDW